MKPLVPLHDPRFRYIAADTHTTPDAFRARQEERRRIAQRAARMSLVATTRPVRKEK